MKGQNKLLLNYATVIEALNEYFDRRTMGDGKFTVLDIQPVPNDDVFKVAVEATEAQLNGNG